MFKSPMIDNPTDATKQLTFFKWQEEIFYRSIFYTSSDHMYDNYSQQIISSMIILLLYSAGLFMCNTLEEIDL